MLFLDSCLLSYHKKFILINPKKLRENSWKCQKYFLLTREWKKSRRNQVLFLSEPIKIHVHNFKGSYVFNSLFVVCKPNYRTIQSVSHKCQMQQISIQVLNLLMKFQSYRSITNHRSHTIKINQNNLRGINAIYFIKPISTEIILKQLAMHILEVPILGLTHFFPKIRNP